jgi:molybdate transport system substrate-binding protein
MSLAQRQPRKRSVKERCCGRVTGVGRRRLRTWVSAVPWCWINVRAAGSTQYPVVEALVQQGKIRQDSMVTLARSGVGVAVPKGTIKPDLSSVEALKRTLMAAKSFTYPDPAVGAASGIHFRTVLERLGIAEEVNAKVELFKDTLTEFAISGHADIAITQPMEILATPSYEFVGWLPPELLDYDKFTWAAGVTANTREPKAATALVTFLSSPIAAAIIKRKGMEPNMSR